MSRNSKTSTDKQRQAKMIGVSLAASFHILLGVLFFNTGFNVIYPPPPETGIEVDFELEPPKPIQVRSGHEPRTIRPTPQEEIRLVQRSESSITGSGANRGAESTMGESGDVDVYEPPRQVVIDRRALFPSASNSDSIAPQKATNESNEMRAGHAEGNTRTGSVENEPQARLAGRSVVGSLPEPEYKVNKSGRVVVRISVDQYGSVVSATPGATGTTVQDKTLWEAAKKAALKAKFNLSSNAPAVQEGTITYVFKLQ